MPRHKGQTNAAVRTSVLRPASQWAEYLQLLKICSIQVASSYNSASFKGLNVCQQAYSKPKGRIS